MRSFLTAIGALVLAFSILLFFLCLAAVIVPIVFVARAIRVILVGGLLLFALVIAAVAAGFVALVQAIGGHASGEREMRQVNSIVAQIRRAAKRMDERVGVLETILVSRGRANGEVR